MTEIDWTKHQTIRWAYKVENWHDGVSYMPHEAVVAFRPLYKLTAEELGSFENAKDNLFWVKSCRFEGRNYVAVTMDND